MTPARPNHPKPNRGALTKDIEAPPPATCTDSTLATAPAGKTSSGNGSTPRSGLEGTVCELVDAHRARRSRYHGHRKTHVQHVLIGIAINVERLVSRVPEHLHRPRDLTAFQHYLDSRGPTWECWWRQGK
ncbi:transposase [Streptomyces flavidovirens]|uniref:transposase n=1 Tax=Streptomyces flavidovirens TaxID=67298 RepID=UPI003442BF00